MLREGILDIVELLKATLGFLGLALDEDDGAGKFVGDFSAAALEIFLTTGQILETLLLLLDLVLPLPKLKQLGLGSLDLAFKLFC
jgi:hypothetical protein